MTNNDTYKPGLKKLIHHQEHLAKIEKGEIVGPIHVSVFPNNFCQLDCPYCCFRETERNTEELSLDDFCRAVDILTFYGLKALELSGGGDPLLWSSFIPAVEYVYQKGLKLSLVTNGLALKNIPQETLEKFTWIRPSIQSTVYAKRIAMDWIPNNVKKSMSFIVHNEKTLKEIKKLYEFAKETNTIIRIAPIRPCKEEWVKVVEDEVAKYGKPLLFFEKEYGSPLGCYMIWVRAAIDWRGNFLPCPSIELTFEHFGKIPEDFGVCKINEMGNWLKENPVHDLGYRCSFCNCGKDTNNLIHDLLTPIEDVDFV
jgi:MoaA/NifB/PqqE/SkfB family radical SAM enzyme